MKTKTFNEIDELTLSSIRSLFLYDNYDRCDKQLSFVAFDDNDDYIGFVLLHRNCFSPYSIMELPMIHIEGNGCEVTQCSIKPEFEAEFYNFIILRATIWCNEDGSFSFDYLWSSSFDEGTTQFIADCINGEHSHILIERTNREPMLYFHLNREEGNGIFEIKE